MSIADYYFKLTNRVAELQQTLGELSKAIADGERLNKTAGTPSPEYLKMLKQAFGNHQKHVEDLEEAIKQIERDAGAD